YIFGRFIFFWNIKRTIGDVYRAISRVRWAILAAIFIITPIRACGSWDECSILKCDREAGWIITFIDTNHSSLIGSYPLCSLKGYYFLFVRRLTADPIANTP